MKPIQLVIPMSGQGLRFQAAGYSMPKPMVPVSGVPMIQRLLEIFPMNWPATFLLAENHRESDLPKLLQSLRPDGKQVFIPVHKNGPGHALLQGLDHLPENAPILVSYCDYSMIFDSQKFEQFVEHSACDAAIISYRGFHPHYLSSTNYAFSKLEGDRVVDVREKENFTDNRENEFASAGTYYFKSSQLLKESLIYQKEHNLLLNGEMYTSLTVKALLQHQPSAEVRIFEVPYFFQWGTPEDLKNFEYWERTFVGYRANGKNPGAVSQLIIPMAGKGSRFLPITATAKPLIPVHGIPMYHRAIDSLPLAKEVTIVALDEVAKQIHGKAQVISLPLTPAGQALTTETALQACDEKTDILVSACDHAIVLDKEKWQRFLKAPNCDAAVFTVRGYPGAARNPKAFSYVLCEPSDGSEFPMVKKISLKESPMVNSLQADLLVGTFWFRQGAILRLGIDRLKKKNLKKESELYLDTIFDALAEEGIKSRMISLTGYINWGDPDNFAEACYWEEVFCGPMFMHREKYPGIQQ